MDLTHVEAVLLDMDGTLVDSDAAVERGWRVWAAEYGVDARTVLEIMHGSPSILTVRRLLPGADETAVAAAAARQLALQYDDLSDVVPALGAPELLAALDDLALPWAVVTSADARLAKARLGAAGIDPPMLLTIEDVTAGKPDPEGYVLAAARLGVHPGRCLVVEDSTPGTTAGQAAGATVASLRGLPGDVPLAHLAELAGLLTRSLRPAIG
ncbi:HAD-IA family hydrolase [Sphaerisporangium sp. NPDC051017]|uniref:HAD-IA family hydrolase n=1 Tax=Sphaerisporangium sp. NPDC051017 TaxID=3154636 RepID=UPI003430AE4E